jgi:hypothetical protein
MIANRFRSVGWTGCICAAALSFYLVSQTVATKRAELATVDRRIGSTEREIRQLETEIGTRGGMAQIENWNSRVYGLQAPGAAQFVHSTTQLVALADPQPLPLDPAVAAPRPEVQQASLTTVVPTPQAAPAPTSVAESAPAPQPMVRQATFVQTKRQALAVGNDDIHLASQVIEADPVLSKPAVKAVEPKRSVKPAIRLAEAESKSAPPAKVAEPKSRSKPSIKLTSLDDKWLADVTGEPATKHGRKGRP